MSTVQINSGNLQNYIYNMKFLARRQIATYVVVLNFMGCQSMADDELELKLNPDPHSISDIITNLKTLAESNLLAKDGLFDPAFLSKYFGGDRIDISNRGGMQEAMISQFGHLKSANSIDAVPLKDAFIAFNRNIEANGDVNFGMRFEGIRALYQNSVDYVTLQNIFHGALIVHDPLDRAHYFPTPTSNPHGDHYYACSLPRSIGKAEVLATVGPLATLERIAIGVEGARQ